jgi:hypothetical protein
VQSDNEHVFPKWLQRLHDLWNRKLSLPNFLGRNYKSIKVKICIRCNNVRFGRLENVISPLASSPDAFNALSAIDDDDLAFWLGKIFWLLCRKSHASPDPKTLGLPQIDQVVPNEMIRGTTYLGILQRAFAMKKGMYACYSGDPPIPEYFYDAPYSLYRFRIDTRDPKTETFDFKDNVAVLGAALRTGNFGVICIYDGGLHRRFRSHWMGFLQGKALHPHQFSEVAGRIFYDQTVLDPEACEVSYFWNRPLNSVVAMTKTPRNYDPYRQENHDVNECAKFLSRFMGGADPASLLSSDGKHVRSALTDSRGRFSTYPTLRIPRKSGPR